MTQPPLKRVGQGAQIIFLYHDLSHKLPSKARLFYSFCAPNTAQKSVVLDGQEGIGDINVLP
jgi:hypothetical protein